MAFNNRGTHSPPDTNTYTSMHSTEIRFRNCQTDRRGLLKQWWQREGVTVGLGPLEEVQAGNEHKRGCWNVKPDSTNTKNAKSSMQKPGSSGF